MSTRLGSPDPTAVRPHREVPTVTKGAAVLLGTGAALTNGAACSVILPIAGAALWKARFKATQPGSLTATLLRPDGLTPYATGNPTAVAVTANTEAAITLDTLYGEGFVQLTFTPSAGPGVVTFLDVMQLP